MLHEKVGKHGTRNRGRYQVAQSWLNRLYEITPKGDDDLESSIHWFHNWIVVIKMKLPTSMLSQANIRIVKIE